MLVIVLLAAGCVILCVVLHFAALNRMSHFLGSSPIPARWRVALGAVGAIVVHILEIVVFAGALGYVARRPDLGEITGRMNGEFTDFMYFSFVTYTTVGYGDLTPAGPLRILAAVEALTGLLLVAWTASFLFLQMQRFWTRS